MSTPLISVVITTYNYGRFIEEAIDSVLEQEFPREQAEVVIVDDGSTDGTTERVKKYGERVRYFYQENRGQAAALNRGFAEARGEIISLLDADDYFLPGKLARVAEAFARDAAMGMFYHPFLEFDMETKEQRVSRFPLVSGSPYENPAKFLGYGGPGTCVSFRRAALDRLLPVPAEIRMLADGYLGSLIIFVAPIRAVPDCLAAYRFHGRNCFYVDEGQVSREVAEKRLRLFTIEYAAMQRWVMANGLGREAAVRRCLSGWSFYIESLEFLIKVPNRLKFFWWLVRKNHVERIAQTRKFTMITYLTAMGVLLVGYVERDRVYKWRDSAIEAIQRGLIGSREPKQGASGH